MVVSAPKMWESKVIGRPFDYRKQMKVKFWKVSEPNEPGYDDALIRAVGKAVEMSQGRAFVLLTSYRIVAGCS